MAARRESPQNISGRLRQVEVSWRLRGAGPRVPERWSKETPEASSVQSPRVSEGPCIPEPSGSCPGPHGSIPSVPSVPLSSVSSFLPSLPPSFFPSLLFSSSYSKHRAAPCSPSLVRAGDLWFCLAGNGPVLLCGSSSPGFHYLSSLHQTEGSPSHRCSPPPQIRVPQNQRCMSHSEGLPQGKGAGGPVPPTAEVCSDKSVWGERPSLSPDPQFLKAEQFPHSSRLLQPRTSAWRPCQAGRAGNQAAVLGWGRGCEPGSQLVEPGGAAFPGEALRPRGTGASEAQATQQGRG